jgi:hypothetical protein
MGVSFEEERKNAGVKIIRELNVIQRSLTKVYTWHERNSIFDIHWP